MAECSGSIFMRSDRFRSVAEVLVWITAFLCLAALLQNWVPYPVDDDTAYHFTVGQLISKYGVLHDFPWTTFSSQHGSYADKEFLFHLLFLPLGGFNFVTAARVVGTVAGALALTTLYLFLRSEKVQYAGLWTLLTLTCSEFVFRFALVRPHLVSITLALLVAWALARGRLLLLAIAAVLYPLCYVAFWQVPLIILAAMVAARLASREPLLWKPVAVLAGGIVVGLMLHPNTLNLLKINWLHMSDVLLRNAWGGGAQNLGKEFNPFTMSGWGHHLVIMVLLCVASLVLGLKERHERPVVLAFALVAVAFGLLTVKSLRFVEYFVPFTVVAAALSSQRIVRKRVAVPALLGVAVLYQFGLGLEPFRILASKKPYFSPQLVSYLSQSIAPDAQVFTTSWDYTGNLMLALPGRKFIVAADPTMFEKSNPELYAIWLRMLVDVPLDAADVVRVLFRSRYVVSRNFPAYFPFFQVLESDPGVKTLFADDEWVVFDMGEGSGVTPRR